MLVVPLEQAEKEVNDWLDAKRYSKVRREELKPYINNLVEAISEGLLVVNEDKTLTQKLAFPIEDENGVVKCKELKYKFRITDKDKNQYKRSITKDDSGLLLTQLALTGESRGYIDRLDSSVDKTICDSIALFFL